MQVTKTPKTKEQKKKKKSAAEDTEKKVKKTGSEDGDDELPSVRIRIAQYNKMFEVFLFHRHFNPSTTTM